jgi:starch phosphorylase
VLFRSDIEKRKFKVMKQIEYIIQFEFHKELKDADTKELHYAIARAVIEEISPGWEKEHSATHRKAYYFSAEYLIGRMVYQNLHALGILNEIALMLEDRGVDISELQNLAAAVIGNGGLGRLAACFLDSAVVHDIPLNGYGIKYKYGLFYQKIENGFQVESVDDWHSDTNPWFIRREVDSVTVSFSGQTVRAVPYDMPVIGYQSERA